MPAPVPSSRALALPRPAWLAATLLTVAASLYLWIGTEHLDAVPQDARAWAAVVLVCGIVLRRLLPRRAHLALLGLVLAWILAGVGLAAALTVAAWLTSAWGIGQTLLRWTRRGAADPTAGAVEAMLVGSAFWLALWGAMMHFAINTRGIHFGLLLMSLLWTARLFAGVLRARLRDSIGALDTWAQALPMWIWTIGLATIGWVLRWTSFPSLVFDDHTLHLRLWTEFLTEGRAAFDVRNQIWSLAPFATDLLHASLSLIAGTDVRGAMNLALVSILLTLYVRILHRLDVPRKAQWLLLTLLVSTPMLGYSLLSLQTELTLATVALAGAYLVMSAHDTRRYQQAFGVLACAALCAAIKLPGAVLGAALLAALSLRLWSQRRMSSNPALRPWPTLVVLALLAFVALHSYGVAWRMTGSPVFPLYNAVFRSPFFPPVNFGDPRWARGFSVTNYVRAFFHTSAYFEASGDRVAGFQYLILLPPALLMVWRRGTPAGLRLILLPTLAYGLAMFAATQYWRYLLPAMPLASLLFAALFVVAARWLHALAWAAALGCIWFNFTDYTQVSWLMNTPAQSVYTDTGRRAAIQKYAPVSLLTAAVNRIAPGSRVLYLGAPFGATLHGQPLYMFFYAPVRQARFFAIADPQAMAHFMADERVDFVVLAHEDAAAIGAPGELLREHLARYGAALAREGASVLYRISDVPLPYAEVLDLRDPDPAGTSAPAFPVRGATQIRYRVRLRCPSDAGAFMLRIDWDIGPPDHRQIACRASGLSFSEAIPVPVGAREGRLYTAMRDAASAQVEELKVEVH